MIGQYAHEMILIIHDREAVIGDIFFIGASFDAKFLRGFIGTDADGIAGAGVDDHHTVHKIGVRFEKGPATASSEFFRQNIIAHQCAGNFHRWRSMKTE